MGLYASDLGDMQIKDMYRYSKAFIIGHSRYPYHCIFRHVLKLAVGDLFHNLGRYVFKMIAPTVAVYFFQCDTIQEIHANKYKTNKLTNTYILAIFQ